MVLLVPYIALAALLAISEGGNVEVTALHAEASPDGRTAFVSFKHGGKVFSYHMFAFSPYADGRASGCSFQAREKGLWASAVLAAESVTGLFQVKHNVLRLESAPLFVNSSMQARILRAGTFGPCMHQRCLQESMDAAGLATERGTWTGTRWWPGCYSGDSELHELKVGVIADIAAHELHGNNLMPLLETIFTEASFVYEHQLNIKLSIAFNHVYKSSSNAPSYAVGCSRLTVKLDEMKKDTLMAHGVSAIHLFTGCSSSGYGSALEDTLCLNDGRNIGASKLQGTLDWLTFAHELGHNLGAAHSFEEGQGSTGGVMDYGNGLLDGNFQFHTTYRKAEMCQALDRTVGKCAGGFVVAPAGNSNIAAPVDASPFIPSCDFEDSFCGWASFGFGNDGWQRHSGQAPSHLSGYGPNAAFSGTHYAFVDVGSERYEYFVLQSPLLALVAPVRLQFRFWMGKGGTLEVQTTEDEFAFRGFTTQWSKYGRQDSQWTEESLEVPRSTTAVRFRFNSADWKSDVAVDNITAAGGQASPTIATTGSTSTTTTSGTSATSTTAEPTTTSATIVAETDADSGSTSIDSINTTITKTRVRTVSLANWNAHCSLWLFLCFAAL